MKYVQNNREKAPVEMGPCFYASAEEQEASRLQEALSRTPEERFYFLMQLMKLQLIFKTGVIEHKNEL